MDQKELERFKALMRQFQQSRDMCRGTTVGNIKADVWDLAARCLDNAMRDVLDSWNPEQGDL